MHMHSVVVNRGLRLGVGLGPNALAGGGVDCGDSELVGPDELLLHQWYGVAIWPLHQNRNAVGHPRVCGPGQPWEVGVSSRYVVVPGVGGGVPLTSVG